MDEIDILRNRLKAYFRMLAVHDPMRGNELVDVLDEYIDVKFKREWVGLTIEERTDIRRRVQEYTPMDDIKYGEAVQFFTEEALKEKNNV